MGLVAGPVAQPIVRPVVGGWRTLSRRFADILKGRTAIAYDPQGLATMYQDAAGTLPVYRPGSGAVDPPVGLLLDKSQGLELGPDVFSMKEGYYFDAGSTTGEWANALGTLSCDFVPVLPGSHVLAAATNGVANRRRIQFQLNDGTYLYDSDQSSIATTAWSSVIIRVPPTAVQMRIYYSVGAGPATLSIREIKGYHAYQTTTTARPTLSGRYNMLDATETLSTQSVTTAATDYTLRFEGTGSITLSGTATGVLSAGMNTITCAAGTLTLTVAGSVTKADLRVKRDGSSLPAYQRVDSATTYDTVGFPLYLRRDRVDDDLIVQAPAITGQRAWGSIDTVDVAAATIAAGEYKPFGTITAGEPTCTQWIAIDGTLTAAEQAVLERYVYSKSKLPVGA